MVKRIFKSFIPYFSILTAIIVMVIFLDSYAREISVSTEVIDVVAGNKNEIESILQFETEELNELSGKSIESDSIYLKAVSLYREEAYEEANKLFQKMELLHDHPGVCNYMGLIALKQNKLGLALKLLRKATEIDNKNITAYINLAVTLSRMHRYNESERIYRIAIGLNPSNSKPYYNLGLLFQSHERWGQAAHELKKSAELSSGRQKARSLCYLGVSSLHVKDTIQAREYFKRAVEYYPQYQLPRIHLALITQDEISKEEELLKVYRLNKKSYYANFYLGKLYAETNNLSKAEYHLKKALEINPADEEIISLLSNFLVNQQRYDEAKVIISGFAINDTLPQTYFHEARIAKEQGHNEEALILYQLAIQRSGNDYPEAALNKANLLKRMKQNKEAIDSYNAALDMRSDYSTAYYNLGLLYQEMGDTVRTIENYIQSIKYDSNSSKSWYNLASIYEKQGKYNDAISAYKEAIKVEPDYLKALSSLGILYSRLEHYNKAIETYHMLLSKYPDYARGYYNLAIAYNKSGQTEKSIEAYVKVIEVDPQNIKAKTNIGVLYARTGRGDLAIETFRDAVDEDIQNPELRFNLALQYEKEGMHDEAIYQYTKTIQIDKKYTKAYDNLIRLYRHSGDMTASLAVRLQWLEINPDGKQLYDLGKKLLEAGDHDNASKAFRLSGEHGGGKNWVAYWTGMVHMELQDYERAIQYFTEATIHDSSHKFAHYRLGQTCELMGLFKKADLYYQKLKELDPEFKVVHKNIRERRS